MKDAGIMEDDLIAVKKTHDVRNGDIVIARIEDEGDSKVLSKPAEDMVVLEPANEDFNDIEINLRNEDLFIEGKYVGLIREN
jgi:repressor LexA